MKTNRDKVLVIILLVVALSYVGYMYIYTPLTDKQLQLEDELFMLGSKSLDTSGIEQRRSEAQKKLDDMDQTIDQIRLGREDTTVNIQDFLLFLSTKASELDVDIKRFNDMGVREENGVWRVKFDMGLYGYMKDILSITQNIESMGISYDVKSVSIRQDGDIEYLRRAFEEEIMLGWFGQEDLPEDIEIPEIPGEVVETPVVEPTEEPIEETVVEEFVANTVEDQLDILLGLKDPTEIKKVTQKPPKVTNTPKIEVAPLENTPEAIELGDNFRETKMNFDFTIEFIMFADPKSNFSYIDMYTNMTEVEEKTYTINVEGDLLTTYEILDKIQENSEFLDTEITRVMAEISSTEGEINQNLKDYLNYILSKR